MARPIHFDILAEEPERAIKFYEKAFGWKFKKWDNPMMDYWLINTGEGEGIDGGLTAKRPEQDLMILNTLGVDDIDESIKTVEKNGGTIIQPKGAIPTVGWMAVFKDPEGNIFGLMEDDPDAK